MAYTHIEKLKRPDTFLLNYILNDEKTDEGRLVSGYNVDPDFASFEFKMTEQLSKTVRGDYSSVGGSNVRGYSMLQSFDVKDDITPEKAHELGKQFANEVLGGKFEFVIATHIDQEHIHNHIIFNATSFYDLKKFESKPYETVKLLREVSDRICAENGLNVTIPKVRTEKTVKTKWKNEKQKSIRDKVVECIEDVLPGVSDFEEFKTNLSDKGVKLSEGAYLSFLHKDADRSVRARGKHIISKYTKEYIIERIENKELKSPLAEVKQDKTAALDLSNEDKSLSYADKIKRMSRKTALAETKALADTLITIRKENINSYNDFGHRKVTLDELYTDTESRVKEFEDKSGQYNQVAKYLQAYNENKSFVAEMNTLKGKKREIFIKENKKQLELFLVAQKNLSQVKVNPNIDIDKVLELASEQNGNAAHIRESLNNIYERISKIKDAKKVVDDINGQQSISAPKKEKDKSGMDR